MGIGPVTNYNSIFQNYKVPSIPVVSPQELKREQEAMLSGQLRQPAETAFDTAPGQKKENALIEDISIGFRKEDDYGYLGKDADISTLDIQPAISDNRRDSVLKDYQYFVGSAENLVQETPDGMVIAKF